MQSERYANPAVAGLLSSIGSLAQDAVPCSSWMADVFILHQAMGVKSADEILVPSFGIVCLNRSATCLQSLDEIEKNPIQNRRIN